MLYSYVRPLQQMQRHCLFSHHTPMSSCQRCSARHTVQHTAGQYIVLCIICLMPQHPWTYHPKAPTPSQTPPACKTATNQYALQALAHCKPFHPGTRPPKLTATACFIEPISTLPFPSVCITLRTQASSSASPPTCSARQMSLLFATCSPCNPNYPTTTATLSTALSTAQLSATQQPQQVTAVPGPSSSAQLV